jgi:hypothetical protein
MAVIKGREFVNLRGVEISLRFVRDSSGLKNNPSKKPA